MTRIDFPRNGFIKFAKGLDERIVDVQPHGFNNTIHWHIGHVLVSTEGFLFGYPKQSANIPESYHEFFATGTKPADWSTDAPSLSELIEHLEQQLARINNLSDEFLAKEIPFTLPFGNFKTYEDLYDFSIYHESDHLGQIKAMKRIIEAK
ncbi:DinB family protein [Virgibacillus oceani]|uniref:Formate dehydrogenase n=1 Tax=Virgibacillus oceani TaxID=1479511 RepID=A0A917HSG1_9BACI|nr:DinB family protein [Virgibacillus oceani]GGG87946.1 formate dehydrogenase [Virgibacillus oceani]